MRFRDITDVRQLPLFVGALQAIWATISAFDIQGSLFHDLLHYLSLEREWGWTMMLSGLYLVAGALIRRRETLTVALFISATLWTVISIVFVDALWHTNANRFITPITLSMPLFAVALWFCLYRELCMKPITMSARRKGDQAP